MKTKLNLRELKGAPLSIIIVLMMERRSVSVSYLCTVTGYSDKTLYKGLDYLREKRIISQTGRCLFQYSGEDYQLPLYWGEKIDPADPSPAFDQAVLPGLDYQPEKIFRKNSEIDILPENEKIPDVNRKISALEDRITDLESAVFGKKYPIPGDFSTENGEISNDDFKSSTSIEIKKEKINDGDDEEKIPEKILSDEDCRKMIQELNDYFLQRDNCGFRIFPDYKMVNDPEFVEKLVGLHPDPQVLEFAISRTETYDTLIEWAKLSRKAAKKKLLDYIGIVGKMASAIMADNTISIFDIDYHYWHWQIKEKDRPGITIGTIGSRIIQHFDNFNAKTSDPQKFGYL